MSDLDIPEQYQWCQDVMHAWNPDDVSYAIVANKRTRRRELHETLRCMNCPTFKVRRLSLLKSTVGDKIGSDRYYYPSGYRREGSGRLSRRQRGQLRMAIYERKATS